MALNSNAFVEGIDPTSTFGGYASVLLQLIRQALPSSTYGMILFDSSTPDVAGSNAWRKRCIWINTTSLANPTVNVYRDSGSPGWININSTIANNTITTAMIQDAAVTLAKLSVSGGSALQLIRVNAGATGFEFVGFASLFSAGVVPVNSINVSAVPPAVSRLLGSFGGAASTWYSPDDIASEFSVGSLSGTMIAPASTLSAQSRFLTSRTSDTGATWRLFDPAVDISDNAMSGAKITTNTLPVNKLVTGTNGYVLTMSAGAPVWAAPATANTLKVTATVAVPTAITYAAGTTVNTSALGGQPDSIEIVAVCKNAINGYSVGDVLANIGYHFTGGYIIAGGLPMAVENAQLVIWWPFNTASVYATYSHKTTGAQVFETNANFATSWDLRITAIRVS